MSDYLPQEIIPEMFYKLAAKSLMRCSCVCKSWHLLIRSSHFISNHLKATPSLRTKVDSDPLFLIRLTPEEDEDHYLLHVDNSEFKEYKRLDFPFKSSKECFHIVGSSNGLICLVDDFLLPHEFKHGREYSYDYTFILWNPLIKKSITLPMPNVTHDSHGPLQSSTGFGFVSTTSDYKVLRIINLANASHSVGVADSNPCIMVELYSLNKGCWKLIDDAIVPKYEIDDFEKQVFVNGILHWIAFRKGMNCRTRNLVLGFDLASEAFLEIELPDPLRNVCQWYLSIFAYGDSIAVGYRDYDRNVMSFDVWVMEEYGAVGSWTKYCSIGEEREGLSMPWVRGIRRNKSLILEMFSGRLASFDPQTREIKDLGIQGGRFYTCIDSYVESLALLDMGNDIRVTDHAVVESPSEDEDAGPSEFIQENSDILASYINNSSDTASDQSGNAESADGNDENH